MNRKTKQGAALALAGLMALSAVHVSAFHVEAADNETAETLVITTEKDVYVQGGADADKVMGGDAILVKTPEEASLGTTYHRKGLVEFDLSSVPESYNTAVLKLEVKSYGKQYTDSDCMGVYVTEPGWDTQMTWNKMPETGEQAASAYRSDVDSSQVMNIDISSIGNGSRACRNTVSRFFLLNRDIAAVINCTDAYFKCVSRIICNTVKFNQSFIRKP